MKTQMPMLTREVSFEPRTFDPENRTVEMVWTTGALVRHRDLFEGEFDEELIVTEEAVDMTRLASGRAPLLAAHNSRSLRDVLGVVESAWILGPNGRKEGRAKVRFSEREDVASVVNDVRAGILRNVSVGYAVNKWEKRQQKGDEVPVMRAVRWTPMEISLVPMGADAAAQVRGRPEMFATEIEDIDMETLVADPAVLAAADPVTAFTINATSPSVALTAQRAADPKSEPKPASDPKSEPKKDPEADIPKDSEGHPNPPPMPPIAPDRQPSVPLGAASATDVERARCSGINLTARKLVLDQRHADKLIADGTTLDVARDRLIGIWADSQKDTVVNAPVQMVRDEGETRHRALVDALLYRVQATPLTDVVRSYGYQYYKLIDSARECLEFNGVNTRGMSPRTIADMAMRPGYARMSGGLHTTSDFANVLQSVLGTTLRQAYEIASPTFEPWAKRSTVPDYRPVTRVQLSSVSRLMGVNEHGEYKRGTLTDSKEAYAISKFGEIIGVTREVIVNDQLGFVSRIPAALAQAARALESDIVYRQLLANATMADGVALFNATHGNEDAAAVISATSVATGMTLMALQAHTNGSPLNLTPSFLLVPPGLRAVAEQFVNGVIYPAQLSNAVPAYMRGLTVISEARLHTGVTVDGVFTAGDTNGWYLISNQVDTIEYAYMEGEEGLYTETRNGFDIDGVEFKVRLDFGAKALDWRGMVRNVGA